MLLHPIGAEDDHEAIFTEYADSDAWVFTHFAEFVLILVALARSSRVPRPGPPSKGSMA
jgi:hypothetical protein